MKQRLLQVMQRADCALLYQHADLTWDTSTVPKAIVCLTTVTDIVDWLADTIKAGDRVVLFSNGSFDGLKQRLIDFMHN